MLPATLKNNLKKELYIVCQEIYKAWKNYGENITKALLEVLRYGLLKLIMKPSGDHR